MAEVELGLQRKLSTFREGVTYEVGLRKAR
jgi:hypothetical protein